MSGSVVRFGRYTSVKVANYATVGHGEQLAYVADTAPDDIIVYRLGAWLGKNTGATTYTRLAIAGTSSLVPSTVIAYTPQLTVTTVYYDPTGGQQYFGNIEPFVTGSYNYSLLATDRTGVLTVGMIPAADISSAKESFWRRGGLSSTVPLSPVGGSESNEGHMYIWAEGEASVAPTAPTGLGVTNSLKPVLTANFNDVNKILNNGDAWDYVDAVQIRVLQGASVRWDSGAMASTSTERSAHKTTRTYAGSALLYNTTYSYQVRHRDRTGKWSPYASVNFSITPPNSPPRTPTGITPSGSNAGTSLTPVITSNFSDPDETLSTGQAWDYLAAYQIRVTRVSDGATMWAPSAFTASAGERSARKTSRTYAGTALGYNATYKIEVRHRDRVGAWSGWGSTTFSVTSLSTVDKPTGPSGFITNTANPGNITAVYRHNAGLNANAMQARLLSSGGGVLRTVSKTLSVAPNGTLSMTWAESGFGAYVENGQSYQIQVMARDTNNLWSPSWSPSTDIWLNAPPLTPTLVSPIANAASSVRPTLVAKASDPDTEQPRPLPKVFAEIMTSANVVLQTREMTWIAARSRYEYVTTEADLAAFGSFRWRAYSYDGFLYSGNVTTAAAATRSTIGTFSYASVPVVTIVEPEPVVSSSTIRVSWISDKTQVGRRLRLYDPETDVMVYDTGDITTGTMNTNIFTASTFWLNGEKWNNEETFRLIVSVRDATGLWGDSDPLDITLQYTPPPTLSVQAFIHTLPGCSQASAIRLELEQSGLESGVFDRTELWRVTLDRNGASREATRVRLLTIRNPTTTDFLDAEVTSGEVYRYDYYQYGWFGNDLLSSESDGTEGTVKWHGLMLHAPFDPESSVLELTWSGAGRTYDPVIEGTQPLRLENPIGSGGRVAFFGPGESRDPSGTFGIVTDSFLTAEERVERLVQLVSMQSGRYDKIPHTLCWREGRGGVYGRIYGVITQYPLHYVEDGESYDLTLAFRELSFVLGETDGMS